MMWMMPLHLHVNQKSDYDVIYLVHKLYLFACWVNFHAFDVTFADFFHY